MFISTALNSKKIDFLTFPHFPIILAINEPPLPRRKKCPELAYRHNEFMAPTDNQTSGGIDRTDSHHVTRARVS